MFGVCWWSRGAGRDAQEGLELRRMGGEEGSDVGVQDAEADEEAEED